MPADQPPPRRNVPVAFFAIGSEMASFTILGLLLDYGLGTMPGFTIGLTLLGLPLAFFQLVKMSRALGKSDAKKPDGGTGGAA